MFLIEFMNNVKSKKNTNTYFLFINIPKYSKKYIFMYCCFITHYKSYSFIFIYIIGFDKLGYSYRTFAK